MIYIDGTPYDTNKPTALFENLFADGTLTGTAGDSAGFGPENVITTSTADFWYPDTGVTNPVLDVDMGASTPANCVVVAAHDYGDVSGGFKIQYSQDGGSTFTDATDLIEPEDNSTIMVLFDEVEGDVWRFWHGTEHAHVGVIMLGVCLPFEFGIEGNRVGFRHGQKVDVMGGDTLGGQFIPQKVRKKGGAISVTFPWMRTDWVNDTMTEFEDHFNEGKPFAFAGNPAYDARDIGYCWRGQSDGELSPSDIESGIAAQMTMRISYYVGT